MQIKYLGEEKVEIRSKDSRVVIGESVHVNEFELPGPGEYEKSGIFVEGIPDNSNTIYVVKAEEINLCYLGKIARDLNEDEAKEIGDVDILIIPLGSSGTIPVKKAVALISKIDPKLVIPILFEAESLSEFKKSEGITDEEIDNLKIKKSELPVDERRNVILSVSP